jgi:hypothetical protein
VGLRLRKPKLALVGLYVGLSLMLCMVHAHEINFGRHRFGRSIRHAEVVTGQGSSPYTYRVLQAFLVEATQPLLTRIPGSDEDALELGYVVWRFAFTLALLLLFDAWLRYWVEPPWAVAGTILLAALHPVSYLGYWYQPACCADLVLWVLVALLTMKGRFAALYPLVAIGSLNRETAIFAVLIHVLLRYRKEPTRQLMVRAMWLTVCWAVPFLLLRLVIGLKPWEVDLLDVLRSNFVGPGLLAALFFFGVLWFLPWTSWRRRPVTLRRLAVALTLTYLPLQIVFGRLLELRLLLPMALAYIPLSLMALREAVVEEE